MPKQVGILIALILGIRGTLYLLAAWHWTRDRRNAWGPWSRRSDRG